MNYYLQIKNKLIENDIYSRIKDYSKERNRLLTYYEVGKILSEAGKHYGENIIGEYSKKLQFEVGKKYSYRTLNYMLKFYKNINLQSLTANLSWGHWIELLNLKDSNEIKYYIRKCNKNYLTTRELRQSIKSKEYERLSEEAKLKLINNEKESISDLIKNPIIIKNLNNYEVISEKVLQRIILEDMSSFLDELGSGYSFIKSEYKIKIGNTYNYIDILLFNYEYNCFIVVELKVTELKKEHIGQIEIYMNYIDNNLRKYYHDKTIGIIIVKKDNKFVMGYASDYRILSREYKLI